MDDQNTKVCPNCSTLNNSSFTYCKNCGTPLYWQEQNFEQNSNEFVPPQERQNAFYENDGINAKTMANFVGPNADTYLSKFTTMKVLQKKTSWHWPVFILGVLLGPVGIAFWFFYRKMYKFAFLFLLLGTLLSGCEMWASFIHPLNVVIKQYGTEVFTSNNLNEFLIIEIGQKFLDSAHPLSAVVSVLNAATVLLTSMFAFRIYEKFAIKRIKAIGLTSIDEISFDFFVKKSGGTSVLAAVLAPIIYYPLIFIALIVFSVVLILF